MKRVLIVLPGIIVWEKCQNSSDLDMILVRVNICIWNTSIHSNQQSRTKHYSDHLIILVKQRKRFILNKRLLKYIDKNSISLVKRTIFALYRVTVEFILWFIVRAFQNIEENYINRFIWRNFHTVSIKLIQWTQLRLIENIWYEQV